MPSELCRAAFEANDPGAWRALEDFAEHALARAYQAAGLPVPAPTLLEYEISDLLLEADTAWPDAPDRGQG